jgi:hypothetical protein
MPGLSYCFWSGCFMLLAGFGAGDAPEQVAALGFKERGRGVVSGNGQPVPRWSKPRAHIFLGN